MERLKNLRKKKGKTQQQMADLLGLSQQAYAAYENNTANPPIDILSKLANYFGITTDYLLGRSEILKEFEYPSDNRLKELGAIPISEIEVYPIPLLGQIACGVPVFAEENFEGYIYTSLKPADEYFALRVHGDSMIGAGIYDGAIITVHKQSYADSGQIVVALLNDDELTCKRYKLIDGQHMLLPENRDYDPIPMTKKNNAQILGVVKEVKIRV
jgi:repressor LexA